MGKRPSISITIEAAAAVEQTGHRVRQQRAARERTRDDLRLRQDRLRHDVEQILARLHEEAHRLNQDRQHPLAWSVGIAELDPTRPETLEDLVRRADAMMYEHKRRRRKRRSSLEAAKSAAG